MRDKTLKECKDILDSLALCFNVNSPTIRLGKSTRTGIYFPRNLIVIGTAQEDWFTTEEELLHEFAHSLAFQRYGIKIAPHGKEFQMCLCEVVMMWFGDLNYYCWQCEYKTIKEKWRNGHIKIEYMIHCNKKEGERKNV